MAERMKRILFSRIVIDGVHTDSYSITCPSCGKESDVSGDVKNEAERDGKMIMPCCEKTESVYAEN